MPNFVSPSQLLRKTYEARKNDIVKAAPVPVSEVCNSCWYRDQCILRAILRDPPRTCCVYELFGDRGVNETTVEELVKFTCDTRCKTRRQWVGDPCPHDENYCENHCPVSKHIMGKPRSKVEEVPYENYG